MVPFDPGDLGPLETYKLLIGLVVPRPIAWVGSESGGHFNLAPFSFFNVVSAEPPLIAFSPLGPTDQPKDTLRNIRASGVFTHNVVSRSLTEAMNLTSGNYPADTDEFAVAGLTPVMGDVVAAPLVQEADAAMECQLVDIISFGEGPLSGNLIIGAVVRIHVAEGLVEDFHVDADRLGAVGRMAGHEYSTTVDRFTLERPS